MTAVTGSKRLQNVVQAEINSGKRVAYQTEDSVTLESGKRVNNVLHLVVSLFIGFWALVWFIFTMTGGIKREQITVDEDGNVNRQTIQGGEVPTWAKIVSGILVLLWGGLLFTMCGL